MQIPHLDQALLWSSREIRDVPNFPLKPLRGKKPVRQPAVGSLWQRPGQERVNNNKGEVGEAFLKVTWSMLGRGGRGWGVLGVERGRAESGACCRRNRILSWPAWSQRRNIRRWLQLDAGGVRWVDGGWEVGRWGRWLTLQDTLCILMGGHVLDTVLLSPHLHRLQHFKPSICPLLASPISLHVISSMVQHYPAQHSASQHIINSLCQ